MTREAFRFFAYSGASENNRKAKFYALTRAGKKRLTQASQEWNATTEILARFLTPGKEQS